MQKQKFSPKKYIMENGRKLPIYKCYIADGYDNKGLTLCLIIKKQPSGKFSMANFMVDRFCLGIKSCMCNCNMDEFEIEEVKQKTSLHNPIEEVTPEYFHNLVYGALDYAADLGFKPDKDFALAQYLLDELYITDDIDKIEMGFNGKPLFIQGPYDDAKRIMAILNRSVGPGGYEYICEADQFGMF